MHLFTSGAERALRGLGVTQVCPADFLWGSQAPFSSSESSALGYEAMLLGCISKNHIWRHSCVSTDQNYMSHDSQSD